MKAGDRQTTLAGSKPANTGKTPVNPGKQPTSARPNMNKTINTYPGTYRGVHRFPTQKPTHFHRPKYYFFRKHWYQIIPLLLVVCILAAVLLSKAFASGDQNTASTPTQSAVKEKGAVYPESIGEIPVVTDLLPEDCLARPGTKREIKFLVIHETGNPDVGADADAHNDFIHENANSQELSWHYTVDDSMIYHHLPDDEIGWHASDISGNGPGIGIEICVNKDGNYEKAFQNGAALAAYLIKAYELDEDAILQHHDFYEKNCPEVMRNSNRWEEFKALVKQLVND